MGLRQSTNSTVEPHQKEKEDAPYDLVFDIDQVSQVGWPIEFPNKDLEYILFDDSAESPAKNWSCNILAIHGQYKRGKTFLLNLLTGCDFPSSKITATRGLSLKLVPEDKKRHQIVVLDTAGIHTPITVTPGQTLSEALAQRKATEFFLRDVAIRLADINLVVITEFTEVDQELILTMCKTILLKIQHMNEGGEGGTRRELYVVHNFQNSDPEEAQSIWKTYVVNAYHLVSNVHENDGVPSLIHQECVDRQINEQGIQVKHLYICDDNNKEGKIHNQKAVKQLKKWIESGIEPVQRKLKPLEYVKKACITIVKNYLRGVNSLEYEAIGNTFKQFFFDTINAKEEKEQESLACLKTRLQRNGFKPLGENQIEEGKDPNCLFNAFARHNGLDAAQLQLQTAEWLQKNTLKLQGEKPPSDQTPVPSESKSEQPPSNQTPVSSESKSELKTSQDSQSRNSVGQVQPEDLVDYLYLPFTSWKEYLKTILPRESDRKKLTNSNTEEKLQTVKTDDSNTKEEIEKIPEDVQQKKKMGWRDHIALYALANNLNCEIVLISSSSRESLIIEPLQKPTGKRIFLAHWHRWYYAYLPTPEQFDIEKLKHCQTYDSLTKLSKKWVLRTKRQEDQVIALKDYSVDPNKGIIFNVDQFLVKYTEREEAKHRVLELDVPDSKNIYYQHNETNTRKILINGVRSEIPNVVQNTRSVGVWKFVYEVPKEFDQNQPQCEYKDGVLRLKFRKSDGPPAPIPIDISTTGKN